MRTGIFILITFIFCLSVNAQNYKKVRVDLISKSDLKYIYELDLDIDHINVDKDLSAEFFLSEDDFIKLSNSNLHYEILIDDWYKHYDNRTILNQEERETRLAKTASKFSVTEFDFGSMGGFYTLEEAYAHLDNMYLLYPELITARDSIGSTIENRGIYNVKISDNPNIDEDEPEALYTALHHAREPESMMQMIYFMYYLLENYGTDPEVTYLVENRELYFIPVVNPDGYKYNESIRPDGGGMHRKNRRVNEDGSIGVDLNRNYGPYEYWDSPNGGSTTNGNSFTYRGVSPFSESETETIRNFLFSREIKNCLNYHSYGSLLIYPYGALARESPDSLIFREFAREMTQYNNYHYGTDMQTVNYNTRGNSDDYMYDGEMELKGKIFAMTPEVGGRTDYFWPPQDRIIPLAEENVFPNLYYAWMAGGFIVSEYVEMNKEYALPGDTISLSIFVRNKGLSEVENASANLTSEYTNVEIISNSIDIGWYEVRDEFKIHNAFTIVVSDDAQYGEDINLRLDTYTEGYPTNSLTASFRIGEPTVVYSDTSDSLETFWESISNVSHGWDVTSSSFHSAPSSFTESKDGNYSSNANIELKLKENFYLADIKEPILSFWTKFDIEDNWDYGQVKISTDNGASWEPVGGNYSSIGEGNFQPAGEPVYDGLQKNWVHEEINMSEYSGEQIKISFEFKSDQLNEKDGWYLDDIQIYHYLANPTELKPVESLVGNVDYKLYQNYPNPFNPSTNISFSLQKAGYVSLKMYDILGNEVITIMDGFKNAGNYSVKLNLSDIKKYVSSGIYFYELKSGNFIDVKKMVIMR